MAAMLLLTLGSGWYIRGLFMNVAESPTIATLLKNSSRIAVLEQSNSPADKFMAARLYLDIQHPDLAYQRVGEGLELTGMDQNSVTMVSTARLLDDKGSTGLRAAAMELNALMRKEGLNNDERLRKVQLRAQLGQHNKALVALKSYMAFAGTSERPRSPDRPLGLHKPPRKLSGSTPIEVEMKGRPRHP